MSSDLATVSSCSCCCCAAADDDDDGFIIVNDALARSGFGIVIWCRIDAYAYAYAYATDDLQLVLYTDSGVMVLLLLLLLLCRRGRRWTDHRGLPVCRQESLCAFSLDCVWVVVTVGMSSAFSHRNPYYI